jgi:N-methylhydantoinase A
VPTAPGNFSAFGSLISDLRHDHVRTRLVSTRQGDFAEVEAIFGELEAEARATLAREGIGPDAVRLARGLGMRYVGQSWELLVRWPEGAGSMDALEAAFHQAHERRYGHASGGATEIVNFRITAVGVIAKPSLPRWPAGGRVEDARRGERAVYFDGSFGAVPVYVRDRLPPGGRFAGPAIVEEMGSTTVVPPRWRGEVGEHGEILLSRSSL